MCRIRSTAVSKTHRFCRQFYLTESVYKVVLQNSVPAQICQRILYISNNKGQVDGFVRELTCAKRLYKHFMCDKVAGRGSLIVRRVLHP